MVQRVFTLFACLALLAGSAFAEGKAAPAAAQERTAAQLIAQADVSDLFSVAPDDANVAVHRPSGLRCDFTDNAPQSRILVFPGLPRGEDVGCNISLPGNAPTTTFYATRYRDGRNVEQDLQSAVGEIAAVYPGAREFRPERVISLEREGLALPQTSAATFLITNDSQLYMSSVHIAVINGWFYKMRYSRSIASEADAEAAYTVAQLTWSVLLARLAESRSL